MSCDEPVLIVVVLLVGLFLGWMTTTGTKSQWIRLVDVFIYGPILIYAATQVSSRWLQIVLVLMGATTITYNLRNYLSIL